MGRVFERTRHLGLMLVLAIIATFTVAIPSANAAIVSTVFPESGPNVGGTPVTLVGEGFGVTGSPSVTVGGASATSVVRRSDTELSFVTPAGSGLSDIVVTLPGGTETVTVPNGFNYDSHLITPAVETINPASGGQTGGELITITGQNLQYVTSLTVGNSAGIPYQSFTARDAAEGKFISFMSPYQDSVGAKEITFYGGSQTVTEFAGFTAIAPAITKITPNSGSTSSTSAVVIDGVGFASTGTIGVTVGGVPATNILRVSPTQIKATFPMNTAGAKDVVVTVYNALTAPATVTATRESGFLYIVGSSAPTFSAITPPRGAIDGGNTVTISGTNLRGSDGNAATITFDGIEATNVVVSFDKKSATVTVPAHAAGAVTVAVETIDGRAAKPTAYTYAAVPTITSISPSSGVVPGGTLISITGTNFGTGTPIVTVGGAPALCTRLVSPTVIEAVTPPGSAGAVNVTVDPGTGSGTATSTGGYSYVAPMTTPAISSIAPNTGIVTGGTNITITTTGSFPTGTPVVLVGTGCATNVTRVSPTVITATTPAGTVGAQNVSVTFATAHSSNLSSFTYMAAPAITSIAPARGGITGNTNVTITGVGFGNSGTPTVTFGGISATNIVRVNDSTITATTPANSSGAKAVVVTPASAPAITKASAYTYDLPTITSITPNSGVVTGGNKVTIVGTGFGDSGTPTVLVNGTAASNVVRISSTMVTATVPLGAAGLATFNVTPTTGTGAAINSTLFTYMAKRVTPLITSSSPVWVAAEGSTLVYVTGSNFRGSNGQIATVTMGGLAVTDLVVSADGTSMSFRTPALSPGSYAVRVATNEGIVSSNRHGVASPPSFGGGGGVVCDAVSPRNWTPAGGTSVTISGSGFAAEYGAPRISISGESATVTAYTDTSITFLDPGGSLGTFDIDIVLANQVETTLSDCGSRLGYSVITAQDKTINFGEATPTFTRTVTGMVSPDALTGLTYAFEGKNGTSYGPSVVAPTAAGEYRIIPSDAAVTPGPSSNYSFEYVDGTFIIDGIDATVTAASRTIQYGDPAPTFSSSATGLVSGHSLTGATYTFVGTGGTDYPESTTVPTAVGTYSVVPSDATVTGGAQTNYFFTYVGATFTISQRAITITADAKTKTYGDNDPTLTYSVTTGSLAGSDTLAGSLGRSEGENVGTYAINIGELAAYNPNYNITFVSRNLVITRKTISVTADAQTKGYGDADPELTYSSSGLLGGDSLSGSMTRAPGNAVGTYAISQGTLTGGGNYTISSFTGANLTITAKSIQLTVSDQYITYGDVNPINSFSITDGSLNAGDSISSLTYTYSTSQFDVGQYTISGATPVFSSGSAANYVIDIVSGALTVERRSITLSAVDKSKTYGSADPAFTYTVSSGSLKSGDTISGSLSRESGDAVGTYQITPGTVSAGDNYDVTVSNGTLTINQRPITITADAKTKTYGDNDPTPTWQVTTGSLAYSDSLAGSLGRAEGENVGTYAYNIGELGEYNPGYDITFVSRNLSVTKKTISVTLDDKSKSYGDGDPEFTYSSSGLINGDQLSGSPTRVSGENVGDYPINTGTLSGGGNYTISGVTPGTLTIGTRSLVLRVDDQTMTYGDSTPSNSFYVAEGSLNGSDAISSLTYSYSSAQLDAGQYTINGASPVFSTGSANNYSITINTGTLTVDRRAITLSAVDKAKTYGDSDPALTYTVSSGSLVSGDTISGSLSRDSGDSVGSYPITPGTVSAGDNYDVTVSNGTLTINQRSITVTADAKTKTYGDNDPTPTWQVTTGSLAYSDSLAGSLGRAEGEAVGTYAYSIGELGDYNPSYNITFVSRNLTVTKKTISVTLDNQWKTYGDNDPEFTYSASGLVESDSLTGSPTRVPGNSAGTYSITAGTLSGGDNYTISGVTPATLFIDAREITVTMDDDSKDYGTADPASFTYTVTSGNLVNSDTSTGSGSRAAGSNVGDYTISQGNLSFGANYDVTFLTGNFTIDPVDIVLSATDKSKQFGGSDPALTYTVSSGALVSGDTLSGSLSRAEGETVGTYSITAGTVSGGANYNVTVNSGTFEITTRAITVTAAAKTKTYGDDDPEFTWSVTTGSIVSGYDLTGDLSRNAGDTVGTYAITQGSLDNSNYTITFVSANLTITKKTIAVTLDNQTKAYGDPDPAFTYSSTGLLDGDSLTGTPARALGESAGTYAITAGTLSGGDNYTISGVTPGSLTVDARAITVTMDNASKDYGTADPASFSWSVTEGNLVNSDTPTGAGSRASGANAGDYTISKGSLNFGTNYSVTFLTGTFTISPVNIGLTAANKSKQFGGSDPALTYTVTSGALVGGDTLSGSLSRAEGETVGTYSITAGSVSGGGNYNVTVNDGTFEITTRPITVTAAAKTKTYGDNDPEFTWSVTTGSIVSGYDLTGDLSRNAGDTVGTYAITQGSLNNSNYTITFVSANLTITKKTISVTLDDKSKTYGDSDPAFTYSSTGLLDGDSLTGTPTRATGESVGTHSITAGTLTGGDNYTVSGVTPGTLTIDPLDVIITADGKTMTYGETEPSNSYTTSVPLVGSDAIASVDYSYPNTPTYAGQFDIVPANVSLSSGDASNYNFTYQNGILEVAKADVEITIDDDTRQYGETDPAWTWTVTGGAFFYGDQPTGEASRDSGDSVGDYTIRQGTLDAGSNYNLTVVDGTLTITKAPLTVSADNNFKTYGDTDPALTYMVSGLYPGDGLSGSLDRVDGEDAGTYSIEQGTLDNSNYDITFVAGSFEIQAKGIYITITGGTKQYGEADPTFTASSTDLVGSDQLSGEPNRESGENAGTYAVEIGTVTAGTNYNVLSVTDGQFIIDPRQITVVPDVADKIYGDADPVSFAYSITSGSLIGGDSATGAVLRDEGEDVGVYTLDASALDFGSNYAPTFFTSNFVIDPYELVITPTDQTKQYGDLDPIFGYAVTDGWLQFDDQLTGALGRETGEEVGFYAINVGTLTAGSNYTLTVGTASLEITEAAITVTAAAKSKTYGDSDPEFTWTITAGSLGEGDELTGALSRDSGENVGTYEITQGSLDNSNYNITFVSADLTVSAKDITVVADNKSKIYGDEDPELTFSSADLVEGDSLTGTASRSAGEVVSDYSITQGSVTAGSNYNIVTFTAGTFSIDPRPITVTMDDDSKDYGAADPGSFDYTVTVGNLVNSDTATGAGSRASGSDVGDYTISEGSLNFGSNYDATFAPGVFTINPIAIELTATDKSKQFGGSDPALTYTVTSGALVGGDTLSGALSREAGEDVDTYAISTGTISGGDNYIVTVIDGTFEITTRPITVTAAAKTKTYGDDDPAFTWSVTTGSLVTGYDLTGDLSRDAGEPVGTYAITQGSLGNSNYDITFVSANLSITKKTIAVTLDNQTKAYGDPDPEFTYSSSGLLEGDSLSGSPTRAPGETPGTYAINTGTLSGGDNYTVSGVTAGSMTIEARAITVTMDDDSKDYGTADPASFTWSVTEGNLVNSDTATGAGSRASGSNVGDYTISKGSLNFGSNYDVTFLEGTFTINPIAIEVTAADKSKQFGGSDPVLTYTVTSGALIGGDTLSGALARDAGEDVDTYAISTGTISGGDNYIVTVIDGTFEITTRPITVTAAAKTKTYGEDDPAFTWSVTTGSLVTGYDLTGDLSRDAGETVGTYAITQGSLGNSNYDITYVSANLSITKKTISVVVDSQEKMYGESDPELTYTATGLLEGDSLAGELSRASGEAVSSYAITVGSLSGGDNYTISPFTGSSLTITKRPISLTVSDQSMEFGDSIPSNSFEVTEGSLASSDAIGSLTFSYDSTVSNAGTYAITGSAAAFSTGAAGNYDITYIDGELTVDPKPLTYTLADRTIGWGQAIPTFTGTTIDLVGSDAIGTLALTFDGSATEPVTPGSFEVGGEVETFTSGSAGNYVITIVPATLTITGPQYLAFTPDEGFVIGGMPFEITGSGFGFDAPTVEFDGLAATDVVLVNSNTITGLTPEHVEGLVDVVVTTTEGPETLTGVYTYIPLPPSPEISTMFPPQGPTVGGTLVTFTGANLRDTAGNPAQVTFDGIAGTQESVSEDGTSLTVRTPAHIVETVDVEVSTDTGIITLPLAFTYFDGPVGDVSGRLWIDTNFDATLQESESILPNMEIALVREGDLEPTFGPALSPLQSFNAGIGSIIPGAKSLASPLEAGVVYYWVGTTDADGNYTIPQLPYGNYTLVYSMPSDFQETVGGGTPGAIRFVLEDSVLEQDLAGAGFSNLVSNQIVLQETGEPVPFAEVLLRWSGSDGEINTLDDVLFPIVADENGEFIVGGLISGIYDVETYADDPLDAMSKPVELGSYVTQEGGIWELFDEPEGGGGGDDGGLAETGFGAGSMTLYALGLLAAGFALAVVRRARGRITE